MYSRAGIGGLEWGFKVFDYLTDLSPEEKNPFLLVRLQQEENKIRRKPVRNRFHWSLAGQLLNVSSSFSGSSVVLNDWVNSFKLGLGYRDTRELDFSMNISAESAPGVRLATGGLEFELIWFIKLPKKNDPNEKVKLVNPMEMKKMKFERILTQDYEDDDPEAPKIAKFRAPRMDLKFSAGTYLHIKEKGDPLRLPGYEVYTSGTKNSATQIRLGLQSKVKWDKRWYSELDFAFYNYPVDSIDSLGTYLTSYTMTGALFTGRFSRSAAVQAFPKVEVGASQTYVFNSRKKASLESWVSFYQFPDLSMVVWGRPSMQFEVVEDWSATLSLDVGATRGGMLLLGGAQVAHRF